MFSLPILEDMMITSISSTTSAWKGYKTNVTCTCARAHIHRHTYTRARALQQSRYVRDDITYAFVVECLQGIS
jgi:hypothetical protein